MEKILIEKIKVRAMSRIPLVFMANVCRDLHIKKFYLAGNSLNVNKPNDLDMYFDTYIDWGIVKQVIEKYSAVVLYQSKNALTFKVGGIIIQFCCYTKPSLKELVESFDYAHVKIGVQFEYDEKLKLTDTYVSNDYIQAKLLDSTFYTGSEYPLSSLIRMFKYVERGDYAGKSYRIDVLKILADIIKRGYFDYADFKDQLDAIDLAMVDEGAEARDYYGICCKRGLVKVQKEDSDD